MALRGAPGMWTHRDLVLPGEVGGLAEQLRLGYGEGARRGADEHRVVEARVAGRWRQQVAALWAEWGELATATANQPPPPTVPEWPTLRMSGELGFSSSRPVGLSGSSTGSG